MAGKRKKTKNKVNNENVELSAEDKAIIDNSVNTPTLRSNVAGLENIDPKLFPPPRYVVVQYSTIGAETPSGKEIPAGKIWNKATGEITDEVNCAFLKAGITRARFEPGVLDSPPLCSSQNGLVGSDGQDCSTCPHSQWTEKPPECRMSIEFIGVTEGRQVFVVRFSGTSFKHARDFIANVRYSNKPLFAHKVQLVTEKQESSKGKYFELKVLNKGLRTDDEIEALYDAYVEFGRAFMPSVVEED